MKRRGVTVTESLMALATAGAATALMVQFLAAAAGQRRLDEQRRLALSEVANRLERASLLEFDALSSAQLERDPLSAELQTALPAARLTAEVADEPGEVRGRRIQISLTWNDPGGRPLAPVALSRWRFLPPQEEP